MTNPKQVKTVLDAVAFIRWMRMTVHQAHHGQEDRDTCTRALCVQARQVEADCASLTTNRAK